MEDELIWLRGGCQHDWRLGPLTDVLMRHRPALCTRCWKLTTLKYADTLGLPDWTAEDYEQHKDEVERRFF